MGIGIRLLAGVSALAFAVGCSSSSEESKAATEPGCTTAPACGDCVACYDACVCKGGNADKCVTECQSGLGGSGGSGATGATGGAGSGGSSASGGGGSGGVLPESVTIKTSPRTVDAYEEAFFCQNIANPFGQDVEVLQSESFMTPGSHHMFVFYEPDAVDGPVEDCSGLEFAKAVHAAQTPQHTIKYPDGVGRFFPATSGFRVMAHYLNLGDTVIEAEISVVLHVVPSGTIQYQAASVFMNNMDIGVPKLSTGSAEKTCGIPYEIKLMDTVSHMHQYGTNFVAKTQDGQTLYAGTDWDSPKTNYFEPPLVLPAGTQITWTCSYDNSSNNSPLSFGESAKTNEMCIFAGTYYPAPGGKSIACF